MMQHCETSLELKTVDAICVDLPTAHAINGLMRATWPAIAQAREGTVDFILHRWTHYDGPSRQRPHYHLLWEAGALVGLAHTFGRTISSGDGRRTIMGLANVCVPERLRGRGLGRRVVEAAFSRIDRGDFDCCLFQTTERVAPFYASLGAVQVQNRFFNSLSADPQANPFWDPVAMRFPAAASWPTTDIDLCGPGY